MNAALSLLHRLAAATVAIKSTVPEDHPSTMVLGSERHGSGVVLARGNLILTVNYVVLGTSSVSLTLTDGSKLAGRVVAQDFAAGIALIDGGKEAGVGLSLRRSDEVHPGCEVAIVASTGKSDRAVTDGVISSIGPFDANWEFSLDHALATTAQSPGFGGAPICDLSGHVLGITFLDAGEVGRFSLGIPVDSLIDHEQELLQHGRRVSRPARAWIGCFCYTLREQVVIAGVLPGGPAAVAGLKAGDVVISVGPHAVSGRGQLYHTLWSERPGSSVEMRVYRDDGVRSVTITTGNAEEFFA